MQKCTLSDVLYVSKLSFNLVSVSKSCNFGNVTKFCGNECKIFDASDKLIAFAEKKGKLYDLQCTMYDRKVNAVCIKVKSKPDENTWHRSLVTWVLRT